VIRVRIFAESPLVGQVPLLLIIWFFKNVSRPAGAADQHSWPFILLVQPKAGP